MKIIVLCLKLKYIHKYKSEISLDKTKIKLIRITRKTKLQIIIIWTNIILEITCLEQNRIASNKT